MTSIEKYLIRNNTYQKLIRKEEVMRQVAKDMGCVAVRMADGHYEIE